MGESRSYAGRTERKTRERMRAGSQGGTVPGYDRSRRYPPRGVWFGLVLVATAVPQPAGRRRMRSTTRPRAG